MLRRVAYETGRAFRETGLAMDRAGARLQQNNAFRDHFSRHRRIMNLYDKKPKASNDAFVAPNASVIGDVLVGDASSVWYGAVIRGDFNQVTIGAKTNIQDRSTIVTHASVDGDNASVSIGSHVSIGAGSTLRSCTVEDEAVVGAGAVVGEGATVSRHAKVADGAVVAPGTVVPSGELWSGNPAKFERKLSSDEVAAFAKAAKEYAALAGEHAHEFLPYGTAYLDAENRS